MDFLLGPYHLDIQVEKTQEYYRQFDYSNFSCGCAGCNNFDLVHSELPDDINAFLMQFGVDPAKPPEISAIYTVDSKELPYQGCYYICGKILSGKDPYVRISEKARRLNEEYQIRLSRDFSFYFEEDLILDKDFPKPIIRLSFTGTLPWVLDEPNPYLV